jgi:hypothetical protein
MKSILMTTLLLVGIWFGSLSAAPTSTIYVDASNNRPGNGTQSNPYKKIQPGIVKAKNGNTVLVMRGTYNEAIDFLGKAITVQSYEGPTTTIIDGTGLGQVSLVTFKNGEQGSSVLMGFTLQDGQGSWQVLNGATVLLGGGIVCVSSSPTISNVAIRNCNTGRGGAVAGINGSNFVLSNSQLTNNSATINGGAVYLENSAPSLMSCIFTGNSAGHVGGAVSTRYSNPLISACQFYNNDAADMGGGARFGAGSSATLDHCTFQGNSSNFGGGVAAGSDTLTSTFGTVWITNSTFSGNVSPNGSELSINGNYPAYINISYSYVLGGSLPAPTSVYVQFDINTYLIWGPGMRDTPDAEFRASTIKKLVPFQS